MSIPGSAVSNPKSARSIRSVGAGDLLEEDEEYQPSVVRDIDTSYSDPLGPAPERPRTSAGRGIINDDEFADEEIGDDLLPE